MHGTTVEKKNLYI